MSSPSVNIKRKMDEQLTSSQSKVQVMSGSSELSISALKAIINEGNTKIIDKLNKFESESKNNHSLLTSKINSISNDVSALKSEFEQKIWEITTHVEKNNDDLSAKIHELSMVVNRNQQQINNINQQKLNDAIEIEGIETSQLSNSNPKLTALETIRSFNIKISDDDIKYAYIRHVEYKKDNVFQKKVILCVVFEKLDIKIRVLKEKRLSKIVSSVYFNHALTTQARYLWMRTKRAAKNKGIKIFVSNGMIKVKLPDGKLKVINDMNDIETINNLPDSAMDISSDEQLNVPPSN
jgi:hypothetical protein